LANQLKNLIHNKTLMTETKEALESNNTENNKKPLIVITNDDGVDAKGLRALAEVARNFGRVVIAAPGSAQSGKSHAITFNMPLRIRKIHQERDFEIYKSNGTPVDTVKLAQCELFKGEKIDLLLSGINHGSNSSSSIIYSGTMAAAIEGCLSNIPSIGFSLIEYDSNTNFEASKAIAYNVIKSALENKIPKDICLNVNIPAIPLSEIKGYRITRQALNYWHEEFDARIDTMGKPYYWLSGYLTDVDKGEDTDEWALKNNYVSIQPVHVDMTAHRAIDELKKWDITL
jgi:5'-nucleotidase